MENEQEGIPSPGESRLWDADTDRPAPGGRSLERFMASEQPFHQHEFPDVLGEGVRVQHSHPQSSHHKHPVDDLVSEVEAGMAVLKVLKREDQ